MLRSEIGQDHGYDAPPEERLPCEDEQEDDNDCEHDPANEVPVFVGKRAGDEGVVSGTWLAGMRNIVRHRAAVVVPEWLMVSVVGEPS